jgi:hypothetical protein
VTPDIDDEEPAEEELPAGPDEDDVPPARFVKIEDFAGDLASVGDTRSPLETLNGRSLATPEAVAAALVSAEGEDGVFLGMTIAELSFVIGELGGRQGELLVGGVKAENSFTVAFRTGAPAEDPEVTGPSSHELRGAGLLMRALGSQTTQELLDALGSKASDVAPRLEALLKLLFEHRATLDLQTPQARPIRVTYERAAALYNALREPFAQRNEHFTALARLEGAYFDTRDFKLRLDSAWRRKTVILGKFPEEIAAAVEAFVNRDVLAEVQVAQARKGAHEASFTYTLVSIREPPQLFE